MSPQPIGGTVEYVMKQQKELRVFLRKSCSLESENVSFREQSRILQKALRKANEKSSIYKEKLEIIKKLRTQNKVKFITDRNHNQCTMTTGMDDNKRMYDELKIQYDALETEIRQKNKVITSATNEITDLKVKCVDNLNKKALENELVSIQRKLVETKLTLVQYKRNAKKFQSEIADLQKKNEQLEQENTLSMKDVEAKYNNAASERMVLLSQMEALKNEHRQSMHHKDSIISEIGQHLKEQTIKQHNGEMTKQDEYDQVLLEKKRMNTSHRRSIKQRDAIIQKLNERQIVLERRLNGKIKEMNNLRDAYHQNEQQYEQKCRLLTMKYESFREQNKAHSHQKTELNASYAQLEQQNGEYIAIIHKYTANITKLEEEIKNAKEEIKCAKERADGWKVKALENRVRSQVQDLMNDQEIDRQRRLSYFKDHYKRGSVIHASVNDADE